jgi:hypothetical protein
LKDPQQCEVTTLREDKNKNGKRNPETQITGKKERKLSMLALDQVLKLLGHI